MVATKASLAIDKVCNGVEVAISIPVGQEKCPITAGLTSKD